ncbi:hypothetical protein VPIG_00014 [Vibrio phage PWH3a-P1]|uniref:hypothetical protein n=1 Tax=Vibrio phage PWH3a-P1 TaxID=754058 RepID=UPI0002C0BC29|nr:hypothetical protein VPIG_00014 [Vibrio phage PWH3a-P1]AGH31872.1 hypothetical protein VPIG_00014 [Vibrio phage PWH3a-P1]
MIKNIEFTHNHNGETYTVLVEYIDAAPLTFDSNQASCPTDLYGDREILDVVVIDAQGGEVDSRFITDEMIWFEIDVCKNTVDDVKLDTTGLTFMDLWNEGEDYYEE